MFSVSQIVQGPEHLIRIPNGNWMWVLPPDSGLFSVSRPGGPQTPGCAVGQRGRARARSLSITQSSGSLDTQNENHRPVSVNTTSGSFKLLHTRTEPPQSPALWSCTIRTAQPPNFDVCTLYPTPAASGLLQCLSPVLFPLLLPSAWLSSVPVTIFLQNFLFTLWAPLPSRVSIGYMGNSSGVAGKLGRVWLFTKGLCAYKAFKSIQLIKHAFAFWGGEGFNGGGKSE